ncbi:hypothetical protein DFH07DRAFT_780395 [Mycena maculata]|uniref:RNase H type-1 domain-containing protein n=1 Tax=Mycena maculata TaxID=230809 RepID=A0AAD7I4T2_9AGAR|nr:hypothetical protein DFH07DRAFT_780395 [Mycena maculata]
MTNRSGEPKERPEPPVRRRARAAPAETISVYIAGAVHAPPRRKPSAASGRYIEDDSSRNRGRCIPITVQQTQHAAELHAALDALRCVSSDSVLTIVSTQSHLRDAINKKLPQWEHEGWVGVPNREILCCLAAELKARKAPTFFRVAAPGSPERALCRQAAMLAKRAVRAPTEEEWDFTLPNDMGLPGLSLQGNRQRVFYRSIREAKAPKVAQRQSTVKKLRVVREAAENIFGRRVTDADIWKAATAKDILPRTAQFLWKGLHDAHRIGH